MPKTPKIWNTVVPIPNYAIPHIKSKDDSEPVYRHPPQPVKRHMPEVPRSLSDIDPELNTDFGENSPFQASVISERYQRLDKTYFQESQEFESLINTGRLVQKFLLKQADIDIDKLLNIIQRKVLKGIHLPVTVKEIQAGYLISP